MEEHLGCNGRADSSDAICECAPLAAYSYSFSYDVSTAQPTSSPTPTPIIAVEVTSTVAGVTADAFQNTVFVDAFKTTVAAAITGVDADMVTNLRVDGVPVNRRLTDGVEVTYEIVVPAATAAASGYDDVDALSSGVSTSLVAAADTFVETVQNEVEAIAAAAPAGSTEAAEAAAAATHAEAITTVLAPVVVVSQTLAPTPRPSPAPSPAPTPAPTTCDPSSWPDLDTHVCGACKALVNWETYGSTCGGYCSGIGLTCVDGWEEEDDDCNVKEHLGCDGTVSSSDAICECATTNVGTPTTCDHVAGQPFVLVASEPDPATQAMLGLPDGEFSVGLNHADRHYIADETPNVHSNTFVSTQTTEGTKMLHRSTDNNIVFPDMPDEWTTDATRPPSIDEDFLINVGLHVHCNDYAPGAKAIALGNYHESVGSWVVNEDGTISPHDGPHLILGWGDFTTASGSCGADNIGRPHGERGYILFGRRARDGAEDLVDEQRVARVVTRSARERGVDFASTSVRRRRAREGHDAQQRPPP